MENLVCYFNPFPLQTRFNVKIILIDMYAPYKGLTTRLKCLKETLMATLVSLILEIEFY